jgi:hypothetical protein
LSCKSDAQRCKAEALVSELDVLETNRVLRLTRGGRLLPWLGPAVRGLAARRFKANVCRYPPEVQDRERRECKGCPHILECPYGRTVEPDSPPGSRVFAGQVDATRPLVIAPEFPAPTEGTVGLALPVRVTFIGRTAAAHADELWAAVAEAGRDPRGGFAPDRATFAVERPRPHAPAEVWRAVELPADPADCPGSVDWVRVQMTGPLILRPEGARGRRLLERPAFADLLRASLRVLGIVFRLYADPLPNTAFGALKELALTVPTLSSDFGICEQPKWSYRTQQGFTVAGVVGEATYGPVPAVLVPWLAWGGRLHVGTHRVSGAGGWRTWTPVPEFGCIGADTDHSASTGVGVHRPGVARNAGSLHASVLRRPRRGARRPL